jgi:hypothetical protein
MCEGGTTCFTLLIESSMTNPDSILSMPPTLNPDVACMFRATISIRWFFPLLVCAGASMKIVVWCQSRHHGTPSPRN